ncbi:uncharacterized protein LOC125382075 [Haliotis rufescens]|uniref:uncharacterized protein LOC125382075 n=1 Tax=Haliotis rufescens TaxID=6454 RepID=UPI00201EF473|nr:uncharacterized protein LOC125382075 [Haliotis rufescens]
MTSLAHAAIALSACCIFSGLSTTPIDLCLSFKKDSQPCDCCRTGYKGDNCTVPCPICERRFVNGNCTRSCSNKTFLGDDCDRSCPPKCMRGGVCNDKCASKTSADSNSQEWTTRPEQTFQNRGLHADSSTSWILQLYQVIKLTGIFVLIAVAVSKYLHCPREIELCYNYCCRKCFVKGQSPSVPLSQSTYGPATGYPYV